MKTKLKILSVMSALTVTQAAIATDVSGTWAMSIEMQGGMSTSISCSHSSMRSDSIGVEIESYTVESLRLLHRRIIPTA